MSIRDKIRQVNPRQEKSVKFTPISEGGLGLSPGPNNDDIKKPKQNVQAKYWYDKYEELVKEVSYHRKMDRQNLTELEDKVVVINEGLLDEIASINNSDPLAPLEKKFVTLDKLAEHYKLFLSRIQEQIATIGGGGAVELTDLDDVDDSNRSHKSIIMYNDVTGKYEASDPDMNAGISNEDHSGDEIILNATDSSGTDEGGSIRQENKTATAVPSPTGDIVHTGNLETTGNASISGTLGVGTDGDGRTDFNGDVKFNGNTSGALWDYSTNDLILYNDTRLEFGSNKDFEIWHGGSHTFMKNSGGDLRIRGDVLKLARADGSEFYLVANVNNEVTLYHNGNAKIATTSSGIDVTGNVVISDAGNIGSSSDTDAIAISSAGLVTLSASASLSVTGTSTFNDDVSFPGANYNILWDEATSKFKFDDDAQCVFGSASGGDMRLFHSGGNSTIKNETGQFRLAGNDIRLQTQNNSEDYIICTDGAAVQIYHNDVEALSTTTSGIQVGASNTDATITTNGTGDLTISTNSGTNSGTIKIEDGANQDITVETNGTGDILLITGGEVGIGLTSPDTALHIKETDATLTLQRVGDTNTPGIDFQSNGGNVRAKIFMDGTSGTNKEIVFQNMNGDASGNMEERFRVTLSGAKVTGNFEVTGAQVDFTALPTSDPSVAGRLWNDSNTVKVSAG